MKRTKRVRRDSRTTSVPRRTELRRLNDSWPLAGRVAVAVLGAVGRLARRLGPA
ncbi:MAG: hypothetical protein IT348_12550 [Candidatus Eisenbacteria bacterium]|nr:hypothetical protein [Candidatus Eisenbacteria bacterium]